jgi:histidinol-phosphate aminotransferase
MIRPRRALDAVRRTPLAEYFNRPKWRLDKNERLAADPGLVRDVLAKLPASALAEYPDYPAFLSFLAKKLRCRTEELLLTAGSDGAIKLVFETYLNPGDEVLLATPTFAMFKVYAGVFGAKVREVPLADDLSFPTESFLDAIGPKTKLVPVASPNNPTGTEVPEADFLKIIRKAAKRGALVLVDEAYYYFTRASMLPLVRKFDNVVLTRTFSKALGLASLRIGFAHARAGIIDTIRKGQSIFDVNGLALRCAEYALKHEGRAWAYAAEVEKGKDFLESALAPMGLSVRRGGGNFVLVDLGRDPAPVARRLKKLGAAVGHGWSHPALARSIKVTAGPVAVMKAFVGLLRRAL